jgi:hypothetical protein
MQRRFERRSQFGRARHVVVILVLALLAGGSPLEASAQAFASPQQNATVQNESRNPYTTRPAPSQEDGTRLPDWAAPAEPSADRFADDRYRSQPGATTNQGPIKPGVPVDGGLVWLTLAGAGYATKKLYDGQKGEDRE